MLNMIRRNYLVLLLLFIFLSCQVSAVYLNIEGWDILESKGKIMLFQKKDKDFLSETMVNLSVAIGADILKGYSIKKEGNLQEIDYFSNTVPLGLWKIIYNGFDSSGNIYLKIIREKDDLKAEEIARIREKIERVSSIEKGQNMLKERLEMFESFSNFLDKEGENISIDPTKTIIINNLNDLPPFKIEVNDQNSVINIAIVNLS